MLRAAASSAVQGVCELWTPLLYRYQGPANEKFKGAGQSQL